MNELSKIAQALGKKGGKNSVKSRFKGKTKEEISEIMRKVRYSKQDEEAISRAEKSALSASRAINPQD